MTTTTTPTDHEPQAEGLVGATDAPMFPHQRRNPLSDAMNQIVRGMSQSTLASDPESNPKFFNDNLEIITRASHYMLQKQAAETEIRDYRSELNGIKLGIERGVLDSNLKTIAGQERAIKANLADNERVSEIEKEINRRLNHIGWLDAQITILRWQKDTNVAHMHELSGWYQLRAALTFAESAEDETAKDEQLEMQDGLYLRNSVVTTVKTYE